MQMDLKGEAALPLVDPLKGYLGCWSRVGGVMGPCVHCARNPYRMVVASSPFGTNTCWGAVGYHPKDSSQNDINYTHTDAQAQFIYVPHDAAEKRANGIVRFNWRHPWFQVAAGFIEGCGNEEEMGCSSGYRICAHCVNHGGGDCHKDRGGFADGKGSHRGMKMKYKYVTRNGTVII